MEKLLYENGRSTVIQHSFDAVLMQRNDHAAVTRETFAVIFSSRPDQRVTDSRVEPE